jgi:mRNA-degrading endonuclease toxin of MazEF toxin-antitoxin module
MNFGEIYIRRFPFTSGTASKARPALVLFDLGHDVLICRITSAASSTPLDITIADWSAAGLARPSIARLDRLITAEKSLLHVRLGELSPADKGVIQKAWNAHMTL